MTWHLLASNSKLVQNFESFRCSGDNKEKLSTDIRSEYASDFCQDRKSAFKGLYCFSASSRSKENTEDFEKYVMNVSHKILEF